MKFLKKLKERFVHWLIKIGFMTEQLYTLRKRKTTGEYHLFFSRIENNKCYANTLSICQEMTHSEGVAESFQCENKKTAKIKCAAIDGDVVCGTCVSHLYLTPPKKK